MLRAGHRRSAERNRGVIAHVRGLAAEHGLDLDRLHQVHDRERAALDEYLAQIRPPLLSRESPVQSDLRTQAAYRGVVEEAGGVNAGLLGVALVAPSAADLEGEEGERGNPWLLPTNTDRIHVGQKFYGSRSGCFEGYI